MLLASLDIALRANPNVRKWELNVLRYTFGPLLLLLLIVLFLAPPMDKGHESARRMQCVSSYKQLSLALQNYHDVHESLPPAFTVDADGKPLHSWRVLILPYIEQKELYDKIRLDEPWDSEYNRQFHNVDLSRLFSCPTASAVNPLYKKFPNLRKDGDCYLSVVIGEQTPFPGSNVVSLEDFRDRKSDTILLVERLTPVCWMDPNREIPYETAILGVNKDINGIGSFHYTTVCCNVAFCDGSVTALPDDAPPELLEAMLTISGGEKIDDWYEKLRRKE